MSADNFIIEMIINKLIMLASEQNWNGKAHLAERIMKVKEERINHICDESKLKGT